MLRYAARVNGLDGLLITKLDVLDSFPVIRLCNAYNSSGSVIREFPASQQVLQSCEPVYEEMEGWQQDTSGVRRYEDLPAGSPPLHRADQRDDGAAGSGNFWGPDREQTIMLRELSPRPAVKLTVDFVVLYSKARGHTSSRNVPMCDVMSHSASW